MKKGVRDKRKENLNANDDLLIVIFWILGLIHLAAAY